MSESTNTTAAPIEPSEHYTPLSKREIEQHLAELETRGVLAELPCHECIVTVETTVPPEAKGDENQKTICQSCMTNHLRKVGML